MFAAAVGISVLNDILNDRTKPKQRKANGEGKQEKPGSSDGLVIGINVACTCLEVAMVWSLVCAVRAGRKYLGLRWTIAAVLLAVALGFLVFCCRKLIWLYIKALFRRGPMPRIMYRREHGTLTTKCHRCSSTVTVNPQDNGEGFAYRCENCGEGAKWDSPPQS